jgi:hypothetical protein
VLGRKKNKSSAVTIYLELKLMGELTLLEAEGGGKILAEVGNLGDGFKESLVNVLLVVGLGLGVDLLLLLTLKEFLFRTLLVADSLLGEVGIVELLVNLRKSVKDKVSNQCSKCLYK